VPELATLCIRGFIAFYTEVWYNSGKEVTPMQDELIVDSEQEEKARAWQEWIAIREESKKEAERVLEELKSSYCCC